MTQEEDDEDMKMKRKSGSNGSSGTLDPGNPSYRIEFPFVRLESQQPLPQVAEATFHKKDELYRCSGFQHGTISHVGRFRYVGHHSLHLLCSYN